MLSNFSHGFLSFPDITTFSIEKNSQEKTLPNLWCFFRVVFLRVVFFLTILPETHQFFHPSFSSIFFFAPSPPPVVRHRLEVVTLQFGE